MTHQPTRKSFLARLLGLGAVAGLAPRLVAKTVLPAASRLPAAPFAVRPDARAVARQG